MNSRYVVVLGACLTQFTVIGLMFAFGLFYPVFETEFGWSRTLLSACSALSFLMMGILAILAGRLSDRYGPRPVLAVSGVAYGLGFVLMSQVTQPWQLFAIFVTFIGLGMSTHDVVTLSTVARWFEARRGMMTAVVKVGTAIGQIVVPLVTVGLMVALGWQDTLVVLGVAAMILLFVAAMAMKPPPVKKAQNTAQYKVADDDIADGATYVQARADRTFWILCATQFMIMTTLLTIPVHLAVHGLDLGLTQPAAASLLSIVGASSIAGRLSVGGLIDRIGCKHSMALCLAALGVGLAGFAIVSTQWPLFAVVAVYGFAHGGLFVVMSPTVAEYFGMRAHGAIFGTVLFFGTLGGAAGPVLAGLVFDTTGGYLMAFLGLLVLIGVGLALVLALPAAPLARRSGQAQNA